MVVVGRGRYSRVGVAAGGVGVGGIAVGEGGGVAAPLVAVEGRAADDDRAAAVLVGEETASAWPLGRSQGHQGQQSESEVLPHGAEVLVVVVVA